ncbi:unnamed protein product [Alternaria burnsii]|nr:unnamed protein product [Alternaria burnsii]
MSTIYSYLEALIALSGDEQLVSPRRALLQSLNDEDLAGLVKKAVGREFTRDDLEDIASVLLDIIVKDPASVYSHDAGEDQATQVKVENDPSRETTPESVRSRGVVSLTPPAPRSTSQASTSGVQSQIGHPARTVAVSLRCQTEQVIANKVTPLIQYVRWDEQSGDYIDLSFGSHNTAEETSLADRFDRSYLSTEGHITEWGKLLRLREMRVAAARQCCVDNTVIVRTGLSCHLEGQSACYGCIKARHLCALLIRTADGVIKLAFFPLPLPLWAQDDVDPLSKWIRSSAISDRLMMSYLNKRH